MAETKVIQLKPTSKPVRKPRRAPKTALFRRHAPALGLGCVLVVLLYLSLNHLAHGVRIVTGCEPWEATAMAIGLDLLIVGLECALVVTAGTRAYKPVPSMRSRLLSYCLSAMLQILSILPSRAR